MTIATEIDLHKQYTIEERDAMFEAGADACGSGNFEEATRIFRQMPIHPRWAKIIAKVMGKEYLRENFNITYANEVFGERWLNCERKGIQ